MARFAAAALLTCGARGSALAQAATDASEKEIERYREMINDPMANPGYLAVDRGEALWAEKRGTKNVSLQTCDLGEGPGKLEGAYAKLPRYFADADKVMDLEQRLLWCMEKVQGLDTKDVIARHFAESGRSLRHGRSRRLHRQQVERHEDRAPAHAIRRKRRLRGNRRGHVLPARRRDGFLLRDLPRRATASAFACRDCRTSRSPARRRRKRWAAGRPTASRRARCAPCSTACGTASASSAGPRPTMRRTA